MAGRACAAAAAGVGGSSRGRHATGGPASDKWSQAFFGYNGVHHEVHGVRVDAGPRHSGGRVNARQLPLDGRLHETTRNSVAESFLVVLCQL